MKNKLSVREVQQRFRWLSIMFFIGSFVFVSLFPFHLILSNSAKVALMTESAHAATSGTLSLPFYYPFNSAGTLYEAASPSNSTSKYFWLSRGAKLVFDGTIGETIQGGLLDSDPWKKIYASSYSVSTDNGLHPQNVFLLFTQGTAQDVSAQVYLNRTQDNFINPKNQAPYNGEMLLARYQDQNNYYLAGIRVDGYAVIKKKVGGVYKTLATKRIFAGTYDATLNPDLIPANKWMGMKFSVADTSAGPQLALSFDMDQTGVWQTAITVTDDPAKFGQTISSAGRIGLESDYSDAKFDNLLITNPAPVATVVPSANYDSTVLADHPVIYLAMNSASTGKESDESGHGNDGVYKGGTPTSAALPNGDKAADFNGTGQYVTVPSSPSFSIPTTKALTWEAWVRPDTLQFVNATADGYVDWMGKCASYSPTCEWEARLYSTINLQNRPNRFSAYVFNPTAGLGSGADWQPATNVIQPGEWLHVVAEYQTSSTPSQCSTAYPGTINIWVNGVKQDFEAHAPTGCMSQFSVSPKTGDSPLNIGTMALDTWFKGAVGKVAVYNYLLSQTQISNHFKTMTGANPSGSCGDTCTTPQTP